MSDTTKDFKSYVYDYVNTCKGLGCEPNIATLYSMLDGNISGGDCIVDNPKDVPLIYKGYTGVYSPLHDGGFGGMIAGINALVMFEASTISGLKVQFELAVDDYIETCNELGYEPEVGKSIGKIESELCEYWRSEGAYHIYCTLCGAWAEEVTNENDIPLKKDAICQSCRCEDEDREDQTVLCEVMSDKHDSDKLSDILDYIENSNLSVELFSSFIREYAESKDIDQAWNDALDEWDF